MYDGCKQVHGLLVSMALRFVTPEDNNTVESPQCRQDSDYVAFNGMESTFTIAACNGKKVRCAAVMATGHSRLHICDEKSGLKTMGQCSSGSQDQISKLVLCQNCGLS